MSYLFEYFDIFLSIITSLMLVFVIFSKKSPINTLINFLVCNLLMIIIAFLILDEQVHIGQFLITNTIFLLTLMIAFFYMQNNHRLEFKTKKMDKIKIKSYIMILLSLILISSFSFGFSIRNPKETDLKFPSQNTLKERDSFYNEKIERLNQNKIFQSLTEIVIIYSGISVVLFFLNKKEASK